MPFPPGMTYRWDHVRRAQYWFWGIFLTFLPAGAFAAMLLRPWTDAEWVLGVVAGLWMVGFFVSGLRLSGVRCPRCQNAFFRRGVLHYHNLFARHCLNCGLKKYAETDENQP